jgi:hypothetical protein
MHTTLANDQTRSDWPFRPAPPAKSVLLSWLLGQLLRIAHGAGHWLAAFFSGASLPAGVVRPVAAPAPVQPAGVANEVANAMARPLTRKQMVLDVCLVLMWAAMVPGFLWLGHLAGF